MQVQYIHCVSAYISKRQLICHSAGYRGKESWTTEHHLVKGERISQDRLLELITEQKDKLFVACLSGEPPCSSVSENGGNTGTVAGCICAEWAKNHDDLDLPEDNAMLGLFAVDPAFQSRGIGKSLMKHAEQFIKQEWECSRIVMWVIEQRGDIMQWYKRCGYLDTGEQLPFVMPDLALIENMQFNVLAKAL